MLRFVTLIFVCLLAMCGAARAASATVSIPFSELGYGSDVSIVGPNPKFSLFIPVYPQLKSIHVRIPVALSPVLDRRSTLTLSVNDRPIYTTTIGALGRNPVIDHLILVPAGAPAALDISLKGRFFRPGDICYDLGTDDFWMNVMHIGALSVTTASVRHKPFIRDFLRDYNGSIAVVVPSNMKDDQRYSALRLAYYLHQTNRWRHTSLSLRTTRDPASRNVVFGNFSKAIEARGEDLYVNADGLTALVHQLDRLSISENVQTSSYTSQASPEVHERTFDDLGIGTQTQVGIGDLPFLIPLGVSQIGGMPSNLSLHIALNHTSLVAEDRAVVKIMMNSTLVRSFELRPSGGQEDFDIPLSDELLRATNDLRVVPSFYNKRGGCKGTYPRMTVSLLSSSKFSWDALSHETQTVGDFYNMAGGRVVALIADPALVSYAFSVLDSLGAVNTSINELDVRAYDGTIPPGYDYAIIVAAPQKVGNVEVPLTPDGKQFAVTVGGAGTTTSQYRAEYSRSFGVLEVGKNSSTLVATYWKDASAAAGLAHIAPAELASQADDLFIFNQETTSYSSTKVRPHRVQRGDILRQAMIPIIGAFLIALAVLVILTARRARNVS